MEVNTQTVLNAKRRADNAANALERARRRGWRDTHPKQYEELRLEAHLAWSIYRIKKRQETT